MVMKIVRTVVGGTLAAVGIIFSILPGSILLVIGGLFLLSFDWPIARKWLAYCQNLMAKSARKLDNFLLRRKLR